MKSEIIPAQHGPGKSTEAPADVRGLPLGKKCGDQLPEGLKRGLGSTQLPGLDGIRAIAAFSVVFYHFGLPYVNGGLGVLVFFVLSGFLITWLLLQENDASGNISLFDFYVRRSLRIFPAFYGYAAIVLAIMMVTHRQVFWPQVRAALLYFNDYYQAIHGHINSPFSHTWSLGIEEQFYVLWPVSFLVLRRNYRHLAMILCSLSVAFWIYRAILFYGFRIPEGYLYEAFDARAVHLLIGCLLAVSLRAGIAPAFWRVVCTRNVMALVAGLLFASNVAGCMIGNSYRDMIGAIVDPLLAAVFIAQAIAMANPLMGAWLNSGWLRYLGRISYSIYLYQAIVMGAPKRLLAGYPLIVQLTGAVASVVIAATLSYYFVERPFMRFRRYFQGNRSGLPAVACGR